MKKIRLFKRFSLILSSVIALGAIVTLAQKNNNYVFNSNNDKKAEPVHQKLEFNKDDYTQIDWIGNRGWSIGGFKRGSEDITNKLAQYHLRWNNWALSSISNVKIDLTNLRIKVKYTALIISNTAYEQDTNAFSVKIGVFTPPAPPIPPTISTKAWIIIGSSMGVGILLIATVLISRRYYRLKQTL